MKKYEITDGTGAIADCLQNLDTEPLILMKNERPIAVLLPVGDSDVETISLSLNPQFLELIQESRMQLKTKGGISLEELKAELKITEMS